MKNFFLFALLGIALAGCTVNKSDDTWHPGVAVKAGGCMLNEWTEKPVGYVHKWCTGNPGPGDFCGGIRYCKQCQPNGSWTEPRMC